MSSMFAAYDDAVYSRALLFNDSFNTDGAVSAGVRAASPGPGTATITDSTAVWSSVSSGILTPSKSFSVLMEPNYLTQAFTYASGRAFIARLAVDNRGGNVAENWIYAGWMDDSSDFTKASLIRFQQDSYWGFQQGVYANDMNLILPTGIDTYPTALEYQTIAIVMTDAVPTDPYYLTPEGGSQSGSFYFFLNGKLRHFTTWGIKSTWSKSNMRGRITHGFSGIAPRSAARVDYVRVRDLGSPFSNGSFASVDQRPPAWNTPYTATADGIFQFVFSSVAVPTGKCEMRFRIQDDNNYWTAYFNIAENCYCVDSVASGATTRRITGGDATTNGTWFPDGYQNGYRILAEGTNIILTSYSYGYLYVEGTVALDHCTSATSVKIVQSNSDYTPQSLICYPLSSPIYEALDG